MFAFPRNDGPSAPHALRPAPPPLLVLGLSLWAAAALSFPVLPSMPSALFPVFAAAPLLGLLGVARVHRRAHRLSIPCLVLVGILGGLTLAGLGASGLASSASLLDKPMETWDVTLAEDAQRSPYGAQAKARARSEDGRVVRVRVYLSSEADGLLQGSCFTVQGSLRSFSSQAAAWAWRSGLIGTLDATALALETVGEPGLIYLRRAALGLLSREKGDASALLQALVCGYRAPLKEGGLYGRFQQTGLAHLVAVSGAHLTLVTAFVSLLFRALRLGRRCILLVTGLFLLGYVGFTGLPVSALRAAVMAAVGLLSFLGRRRSSALSALGLCLVLFIAVDVTCALSVSFILSAGSTLGILLLAPLFLDGLPRRPRIVETLFSGPLALTLASSMATQPYGAALFAQLPLVAPAANVFVAPWFTLGCLGGFAAVALGLLAPPLAPFLLAAASVACTPLLASTELMASIPFGCVGFSADPGGMALASVVLCAGLWLWWPCPRDLGRGAVATLGIACAAAILWTTHLQTRDEIVMLDVGQGDAFLVRSQGQTLLIDTGNEDGRLKEACGRHGIFALDAVAISHPDDDHCGSLEGLAAVTNIDKLLVAEPTLRCACASCVALIREGSKLAADSRIQGLAPGDRLLCGRFTLTVVWPDRFTDEGGNGDSLSLLCVYDGNGDGVGEWSALFCGDAEVEELRAMTDRLPERGIDILKVGHHGSQASLDDPLVEALDPSIALISVGEGNRYGHPSPACLETLDAVGCSVFRSDEHGDVTLEFTAEKIAVAPARAAPT